MLLAKKSLCVGVSVGSALLVSAQLIPFLRFTSETRRTASLWTPAPAPTWAGLLVSYTASGTGTVKDRSPKDRSPRDGLGRPGSTLRVARAQTSVE